jgi:hypothetical protein
MHAAVLLAGKRPGRGQLNALAPGLLLHITCQQSKRRFLVDTGAAFSVVPYKGPRRLKADLPRLRAAGGQHIPCCGELQSSVSFGGKCFKWTFLLADVEAQCWELISSEATDCWWIFTAAVL